MIKNHANLVPAVMNSMYKFSYVKKYIFLMLELIIIKIHTFQKNDNLISLSIIRNLQDMELESFNIMCITETPF